MIRDKLVDLPMTYKLQRLQAITLALALALTLAIVSVTQVWQEKKEQLNEIRSLGKMIGFSAGAALLFGDAKTGSDILATLRGKPEILSAQLYGRDGEIFANYPAQAAPGSFPPTLLKAQEQLLGQRQRLLNLITLNPLPDDSGEVIGYLRVLIDLRPLWRAVAINLGQILMAMLASFMFAVRFGRRLAASIAAPLTRLSQLARQVSVDNNYMVRAKGESSDEIGQLVKSFNQMIERIQQRDAELENQRGCLEREVDLRTADLRQAVLDAQAASIAKSQFLATMSHEIRTPMNGVLGMTELLLGSELNPTQRQYAETVFSSADSLLTIINDILDFSKIEAGKLELEETDFSLSNLIDQLGTLFFERASSKNIRLLCEIDPETPKEVRGDPYRLRQILTNLLSNAVKFTEAGEVKLQVRNCEPKLCSSATGLCLEFKISDTGIGMNREALSRLFQAFSQADGSTTRKYGGTGLGLVISKELCELMGGNIRVESQPQVGSVFSVYLPLREALAPLPAKAASQANLAGKYVLVVEDNATNAKILENHLAEFGMHFRVAKNGSHALEILEQSARSGQFFDIALLDMRMLGMNGTELARRIRDDVRFARLRLVIISSCADEAEMADIRNCGCDVHLQKPVYRRTLQDTLLRLLPPATEAAAEAKPVPAPSGLRILLAEDNPVNQKICSAMLRQLGYNLICAGNGQEVLDLFQTEPADLILMDCMMPVMDGYTATQRIRELEQASGAKRTPIIALTANAMEGDREKCLRVGMDDYLSKPFLQKTLHDKIRALIGDSQPARPDAEIRRTAFDSAELRSLRQIGGDELVAEVLRLFRENAAQQIRAIATAIENRQSTEVRQAAHSLKSTAANIGAAQLAELARNLEHAARDNTLAFDSLVAESLQTAYKAILQQLPVTTS
ncbi:response regulator [Methylomonas sp. SURF-1]|uniref:histidine kinase n=1 Tax=Methylomonas aurea TaxID=2952224 RepID=A0ABT1UHS1_9GAMM|nr:response regulator [Methylomonas sp. SURF-1]MCQ8181249.1 response regulator [Methylomonas sp. SURF-1]